MGILNVTPDSFSDGGRYLATDRAIAHGLELAAAGADIVDVGGESTRPGARRVPGAEEERRVLPVIRTLAEAGITVSVDTMRAEIAEAALAAGASIVNDVSGGLADPRMAACVGASGVPYVATHWRAPSVRMHRHARYADVVGEVAAELSRRIDELVAAGVAGERIVVDPGLGFAKNACHDWRLLANLEAIRALGRPVLVSASRKSFLDQLPAEPGRAARDHDDATAAVSALAASAGAWGVRVHDVRPSLNAVRVAAALHA
ncbi:dihydropteroate synthase [Amycolatopsis acidicola]|uniref:Dihydropteroate synthase n=1 Tax=Amycolatopsis acidicola TaxID=2596893 RepID=A0A5N0VJI9_9PSEU|nr:dihydropteroate synthase [Amycolatopsis acidicola]KAA9165653.1 dihydropteroate synthase [Amycolatopsis acidicola]